LAPRNLAIVESNEGKKIYIVDTEDYEQISSNDDLKQKKKDMIMLFRNFALNLNSTLTPRFLEMYKDDDCL
jgi:hypothetical protein